MLGMEVWWVAVSTYRSSNRDTLVGGSITGESNNVSNVSCEAIGWPGLPPPGTPAFQPADI